MQTNIKSIKIYKNNKKCKKVVKSDNSTLRSDKTICKKVVKYNI